MKIYIDSNILIYSVLERSRLADKCLELLKNIQENKFEAVTSALTFDEVFFKIKKNKSKDLAIEFCDSLLDMQNFDFISLDRKLLMDSLTVLKKYDLDPRDSLHFSTFISTNADIFVTQDNDFKKMNKSRIKSVFDI
ncbi:MAG: PIN domain-containing protein [Nanoarchaeota archaeon]|nr:PIN domain-containing protein [Nanoarchaeota archaeon]